MITSEPSNLWNELAQRAGVTLSEAQHEKLWRYIDLLLEANQRMNLTRIASRDEAALLHVGDALTLLPHLPARPHRIADVGSGGGVPGIPLAIVRSDSQVVLIESTRKKANFLCDAIATLQLSNVSVQPHRAEVVARTAMRETFDIVVCRAVATLDWLVEWCLPLVKVGGAMLAMKGPKTEDELPQAARAIRMLGGGEVSVHPANLAGVADHVIVKIAKIGKTTAQYPRDPTIAKGKPIR